MKNLILKIKIKVAYIIDTIKNYTIYFINYKKFNPNIDVDKIDKVLFVAHPDDELLFFYKNIVNDPGWLVICMTNGGNRVRANEFIALMKYIQASYQIWNFKDGSNVIWNENKVCRKIKNILKLKKEWNMVATHNYEGEYGHLQHKQLNSLVRNSYKRKNLYTPIQKYNLEKEYNRLSSKESKHKEFLMRKYYKSQVFVLDELKLYLQYEGIVECGKYLESIKYNEGDSGYEKARKTNKCY